MTAPVTAVLFARGGFLFLFGFVIPLLVVGLVAYGIWELVRSRQPAVAGGAAPSGSARALLDERLARGEIDPDDYLRRRALLDGAPGPATAPNAPADPGPAGPTAAAEDATAPTPAAAPSDPVE